MLRSSVYGSIDKGEVDLGGRKGMEGAENACRPVSRLGGTSLD